LNLQAVSGPAKDKEIGLPVKRRSEAKKRQSKKCSGEAEETHLGPRTRGGGGGGRRNSGR